MNELVSISIMTYNQERYIQDTLRSVINQDYINLELVILDDHSTDNTVNKIWEMMEELETRFVRVKVLVNEENTGNMSRNSNILLNEYNGKYFKILGGDDLLTPDSCRKSMEMVRNSGYMIDVVFSDVYIVDETFQYNLNEEKHCKILRNDDINEIDLVEKLLVENRFICIGALCNTNSLREVGGYDESVAVEDYQMWIRLALYGKRLKVLHEPLAMYRRTGSSVTNIVGSDNTIICKQKALTEQIFKTQLLFKGQCNPLYLERAIIYKIFLTLIELYSIGCSGEKILEDIFTNNNFSMNIMDIMNSLSIYARHFVERHNKFLIYGYGKYGKYVVHFFDECGIKYYKIVDVCGEKLSDEFHKVSVPEEKYNDVNCALVTMREFSTQIKNDLGRRGINEIYSVLDLFEEFVDRYILEGTKIGIP